MSGSHLDCLFSAKAMRECTHVPVTNYAAIFDYRPKDREWLSHCNLCGKRCEAHFMDVEPDRYGYDVGVYRCECGLVFLNPRLSAKEYAKFYEGGIYRRLVSIYHGREINAETIQGEQYDYAIKLSEFLGPAMEGWQRTLLDVGGSTGMVAWVLADQLEMDSATVLDPSDAERREAADTHGCEVIAGTAESFDPAGRTWDLITLCQTIDHLLDPMGVLKKLHGCLTENGLLFVDAVDYDVTKQIKIDHPYNFTEATMAEMLKRAGYREVARERAPDGVHVGFLCAR